MHEELVDGLVQSENEAADELLLEGLRLGAEVEQMVVLNAIFRASGFAVFRAWWNCTILCRNACNCM